MAGSKVSLTVDVDSTGAVGKIKGVGTEFHNLETKAKAESGKIGSHFEGAGDRIARRFQKRDIKTLGSSIANSITALATGGSLSDVAAAAGLAMGVSLATQFVIGAAEKLAGSAVIQALLPVLGTIGATLGTFLSTAMAVAMAIWPALLLAAIVAGIVYLINNPEIVGKVLAFVGDVLANLGKGLAKLGEFLAGIFKGAFDLVASTVGAIIGPIVDNIMKIIDVVKEALRLIGLLKAEQMVGHHGGPISQIGGSSHHGPTPHAEGGWVGLRGPEMALVGERGPEYVTPNHGLGSRGSGGGVTIQGITEGQIVDMIDRGLFFKLRRAPASSGRI